MQGCCSRRRDGENSLLEETIQALDRVMLLEYMVDPVPTGFKFAGASGDVGQQADGLMPSDRSAMDQFPENALAVLRSVGFEN
ncbi:hypothetical protein NC652_005483 [Populus alba x Populus x berolinensis]|nr:hypothetical protein NC652_005483 [Populus alba x Populus x berolinensis]